MASDALTLRRCDALGDWYVIERAVHENRSWMKRTDYGFAFQCSSRISDADIEGDAEEMLAIATAIETRGKASFKRCAATVIDGKRVKLWSPRNSQREAEVTIEVADALAVEIRKVLQTVETTGEDTTSRAALPEVSS